MAQHYFNRYIWLISTIKTNGPITLKELGKKWKESPLNETRDNLYERTFHNHRMAIEETFGIKISYTRPDGYYIDTDSLEDGSFREWMLDCLQVNNLLEESSGLHDKILLESIPSGGKWLNVIIDAIKSKRALEMTYKSYSKDFPSTFTAHPYCLKLFKQRWYLLAKSEDWETPRIYSLDRIQELDISKKKLLVPERFNAQEYFSQNFGIIVDKNIKPCLIEIWADSTQANYFKSLPLHHSQAIKEEDDDGTVFQYFLAPTYDFMQEVLRYGSGVQVLSPSNLVEKIKSEIDNMVQLYK
ncbi:MAG: WYL domain-containing protein [Bacteroidales bacterium]|nr:WYL domain-containing protein [Bacteroidales bacterium]